MDNWRFDSNFPLSRCESHCHGLVYQFTQEFWPKALTAHEIVGVHVFRELYPVAGDAALTESLGHFERGRVTGEIGVAGEIGFFDVAVHKSATACPSAVLRTR